MPERQSRLLVTGATGLAGSHTVRALLEAGHGVRAFVRSPDKARRVFEGEAGPLELAKGDIGDLGSVRDALQGCDGVVHCAAIVAIDSALTPDALLETNVSGVRNVIGAAIDQGLERIVHVSSVATLFRGDGTLISEDSEPRESKHAYGRSKTIAENYVRELQDEGHPVKIVYPGAIIAPDDPGLTESMNAVRVFMRDFIPITSSGMQFIDARDLAVAHVRMVEAEPGAARYLAAGTFVSWKEIADIMEATTGVRPRTVRVPGAVLRVVAGFLDLVRRVMPVELPLTAESAMYVTKWDPVPNSKALEAMGVRLRDVSESLGDAARWIREAGHM